MRRQGFHRAFSRLFSSKLLIVSSRECKFTNKVGEKRCGHITYKTVKTSNITDFQQACTSWWLNLFIVRQTSALRKMDEGRRPTNTQAEKKDNQDMHHHWTNQAPSANSRLRYSLASNECRILSALTQRTNR